MKHRDVADLATHYGVREVVASCASSLGVHWLPGLGFGNEPAVGWSAWETVPVGVQVIPERGVVVSWVVLGSGRLVPIPGVQERQATVEQLEGLVAQVEAWAWERLAAEARTAWQHSVDRRVERRKAEESRRLGLGDVQEELVFVPTRLEQLAVVREVFGPWARLEGAGEIGHLIFTAFEAFEVQVTLGTSDRPYYMYFRTAVKRSKYFDRVGPDAPADGVWGAGRDRYVGELRRGLEGLRQWCIEQLPHEFVAELEDAYGASVDDRSLPGESSRMPAVVEVVEHEEFVEFVAATLRDSRLGSSAATGDVLERVVRPVARWVASRGAVRLRVDPRIIEGAPLVAEVWRVLRDEYGFAFLALKDGHSASVPVRPPFFVGWVVPLTEEGLEVERAWARR